jgi:hypothetical protein
MKVKPTCHICNKSYSSNGTLNRHIREVHEQKKRNLTYHCLICDKHFCDNSRFQRHKCVKFHKKIIDIYYNKLT